MAKVEKSQWLRINVGGTIFSTTKQTLLFDKNSMLAKMFSSTMSSEKDDTGAYLLDRDPIYFRPVLNFLRTGQLIIDEGVSSEGVFLEAKFFQITALIDLMEAKNRPDLTRRDVIVRRPVNFESLRLANVDLSGLSLQKQSFDYADLTEANFERCQMEHCSIYKVEAPNSIWVSIVGKYSDFRESNLSNSHFDRANLIGANFSATLLKNGSFTYSNCTSG
eukprot:TRINITY_DN560_c0_g1_i3.p1 TRINITY_DN560_c0_g1~~TRINITY_DN560_c0_g1_i3.p1  ORF type:complete len:235 (-),score=42.02 TRINITY_DN560_c0_g1_i3:247-906(-)